MPTPYTFYQQNDKFVPFSDILYMAQMKTSVAKRRQPNQRDGTYMIQKE